MTEGRIIAFKYRVSKVHNHDLLQREMAASHVLYNDLVAIEVRRFYEVRRFWAEQGGYTALLDEAREHLERGKDRALSKEERNAAFKRARDVEIESIRGRSAEHTCSVVP